MKDLITITTGLTMLTTLMETTTITENPDTKIKNALLGANSVLSTMNQRSATTLRFQKCLKNPNTNLTKPSTTRKSRSSSRRKPN